MSFSIFKKSMEAYMNYPDGIDKKEDFAKKLAFEYDMLIRRGTQTVNNVMIQKGNPKIMESTINMALMMALQETEDNYDIINQIGNGVIMYWTGATLQNFPPPIIPATGSFQNITTTTAIVTNSGNFPDMSKQFPITDTNSFLDVLVMAIQIHLTTIGGMYMTISMYPGFPMVPPAPGVVQWTGFTIP